MTPPSTTPTRCFVVTCQGITPGDTDDLFPDETEDLPWALLVAVDAQFPAAAVTHAPINGIDGQTIEVVECSELQPPP